MASVRARSDNNLLFIDFRFRDVRCRELTALKDTPANRKRLQALANRIQKEISQDIFDYGAHFPSSPRAEQFASAGSMAPGSSAQASASPASPNRGVMTAPERSTPCFSDFAELWCIEMKPQWRASHQICVRGILDKDLIPLFGARPVHTITKADVLAFRAGLAQRPGRKSDTLSAARINKILCFLRQILNEASDRYEFTPAFRGIKPLKQKRADVQPFTLDEVQRILEAVREDYRDYLTVRFFTGLRTGEINGLKWKHVDLEHNLLLIRESVVNGEERDDLKTEYSQRDIAMLPLVRSAIDNCASRRQPDCPWVFSGSAAGPIDAHNFCNRIWYPLLRYLGMEKRRPYQTRHTAATLMLAAGESPEWIAQVMGHSTTAMLFKVYSRFVPNLTRMDGQAFAGLLHSQMAPDDLATDAAAVQAGGAAPRVPASPTSRLPADTLATLQALSPEKLSALLALAGHGAG